MARAWRGRAARRAWQGLATTTAAIGIVAGLVVAPVTPAAAVAPIVPAQQGLLVDGWGGLHNFSLSPAADPITGPNLTVTAGTAAYWPGWDIARAVALRSPNPGDALNPLPHYWGGYVLDGWGGIHPFGLNGELAPARPSGAPYWKGWDIARGFALVPQNPRDPNSAPAGAFVLDGWGGLHYVSLSTTCKFDPILPPDPNPCPTPTITGLPYWPGWDIARQVVILDDASGYRGGYVIDGWGGVHPFSINGVAPPAVQGAPYWPGWAIARGGDAASSGTAGYFSGLTLDGWGGLHPWGAGGAPTSMTATGAPYWPGWDIARGVTLKRSL